MTNIHYDNSKEGAFKVHTNNGIVKFTRDGRLYTYQPTEEFFNSIAEKKRISPDTETENKNSNKSDSYNSLDFVMSKKAIETARWTGNTNAQNACGDCISTLVEEVLKTSSIIYARISLRTTL